MRGELKDMNRFTYGGRLTALHKNNINQHELIQNLHKVAKENIDGQIHKNDNGSKKGRR